MITQNKRKCLLICSLACILILFSGVAFGATINVPSGQPTIQAGIDAAMDGADEVVIATGTYIGPGNVNLNFGGKEITVRSATDNPADVIIDCENVVGQRGVYFQSTETSTTVLQGITIRNGNHDYGGGIRIGGGSSPTIDNCVIENCTATIAGGGINVYGSSPTITGCTITGNLSTTVTGLDGGGGIRIAGSSNVIITNSNFDNNTSAGSGGGIFIGTSDLSISGCTMSNNTATVYDGGAIVIDGDANVTIESCEIYGNAAAGIAGALRFQQVPDTNTLDVINCLIFDNTSNSDGAAVDSWEASPTLINCTITQNLENAGGAVIHAHTSYPAAITNPAHINLVNSIIYGNDHTTGGPLVFASVADADSSVTISYSDVDDAGIAATNNNINLLPQFVNAGIDDFNILGTSPCRDAADSTVAPDLDFAGNTRNSDGLGYDMGAYEYIPVFGTVQFSPATYNVAEDVISGIATITVTRTGGSDGAISVVYATSDGTATGADYTATGGTLSWTDGDTASKTFNVTIIDDVVDEPNETVNLTLSNATGGATIVGTNPAVLTITDDDIPGTVQFSAATYTVAEDVISGIATITVSRTVGSDGAISVDYATSDGTTNGATAGTDYTAASGTLSWINGETAAKTFTVPIIDDVLDESNETVGLTLSNATGGAAMGTSSAVLTITDDDVAGTVQFSAGTYSIGEAGVTATITVSRTVGSDGAISVDYATSDGTTNGATAGSDYTAASGTLNWTNGESGAKTFTVAILDDMLDEPDETVNLALSNVTGGATPGAQATAVLTIIDDEPTPGTVQFSSATYSVSETGPTATITASRTVGSDGAISVDYDTIAGGSATAGSDYTPASGTLNWTDGESGAKTFTISIIDDVVDETGETVNIALSNQLGGATLGTPSSAVLTIIDNDTPGSVQFSTAPYSIGEAGSTATITVNRISGSDGSISVDYASSDGTATAGADYTATGTVTLNWAHGDVTDKTFTVTIIDDGENESDETINLTLSNETGGATIVGTNPAVLTITDDESDNDGISEVEESGPNGTDPAYDGDGDLIPDRLQDNVASFFTYDGQEYVTLAVPIAVGLSNVEAIANPSPSDAPSGVDFTHEFFDFTITGVPPPPGVTTVTLYLPAGAAPTKYYKYGPLLNPADPPEWYEFDFDGTTGAQITGNVITLNFVDGERGDDDLTANGTIVEPGGPAFASASSDSNGGGGGGGGGCFIATTSSGLPHIAAVPMIPYLALMLLLFVIGKAAQRGRKR